LLHFRVFAAALLAAIFGAGPWAPPRAAAGDRIVVLVSRDAPPYAQAIGGFREYLEERGVKTALRVEALEGDAAKARDVVREVAREGATLIFTLGSLATQTACDQIRDTPIVAGLILDAGELNGAGNVTGVALEFPLETELEWLRRFLPGRDRVGVLFNAEENGAKVERAARLASQVGLDLVALEVNRPQDLPGVLKGLSRRIDVLWGMPDQVVFSRQTAKAILLFSFRNRIPFVGLSGAWVKAGALYALERDYADLGTQCGEMAFQILQGETVASIPAASPRTVAYVLNRKTLRHLKLSIPEDLIRGASKVFE
jgi:putative ABC transport system substrate-binding protein